jgi:hypothetical protein
MTAITLIWSVVVGIGAYAACMATGHHPAYFDWSCVASGFSALTAYHIGKGQEVGGLVEAARSVISPAPGKAVNNRKKKARQQHQRQQHAHGN